MQPTRLAHLAAVLVLFLALGGCSAPAMTKLVDDLNSTLIADPFAVKTGDRISVQFPNNPEWNHVARVRPDGTASFQFVGRLELEGFTLEEVEEIVVAAFEQTLKVPDLTVDIPDLSRRNVMVIGEIRSPGPVAFNARELSLVEALTQSGGPNWRDGALNRMLLLRWFPEERKRVAFKLNANLKFWGHPDQIWLQPDDIIYVPPKHVAVLGNWIDQYVRRLLPIPYVIPNRLIF